MPKYACVFNPLWLDDSKYKMWLQKASVPTKAFCRLCIKTFDISNMGESALTSHIKSNKHQLNCKRSSKCILLSAFESSAPISTCDTIAIADSVTTPSTSAVPVIPETVVPANTVHTDRPTTSLPPTLKSSIKSYVSTDETLTAEILWALKIVSAHYSFKSSTGVAELFAQMFPDSEIAKKFACGPDKVAYLITFGLGPYFQELLKKQLRSSVDGFVLLFDETLNRELGKKQMDMHVRFWEGDHIVTRYYGSSFLGHATAKDMFAKLQEQLDFNLSKILQISMDGPNVNWALYNLLSTELQQQVSADFKFIDIGSCGLHTIHNRFSAGHAASTWDWGNFFSSLSWLFKDTPARREDFTTVTGSTLFPLDHCPHRCVENIPVAERALKVWPDIKKFILHLLEKKKGLQTKSFQNLQECMKDKLLIPKIESFISIAKLLQPFLLKYQGDAPLLPFMAQDIFIMIQSLLVRFVSSTALEASKTPSTLLNLNLSQTENLLPPGKVDIGFKAKKALGDIQKSVSQRDILIFQSAGNF